ncbi:MAG: hypothetical protein PHN80_17160 [Hespellia sp.]|nr:hypothetical protein [Hespellia sp.]
MRRKKEEQSHGLNKRLRPVYCPKCGWKIMDAVEGTKTQMTIPWKGRYPDFYVKCGHCGVEIGISKTE